MDLPEEAFEEIVLFEENFEAFNVFLQMTTQWNVGGMGSAIGLSYPSLDFVMNLNQVKDRLDCFNRIRILERRALELMGEKNGTAT